MRKRRRRICNVAMIAFMTSGCAIAAVYFCCANSVMEREASAIRAEGLPASTAEFKAWVGGSGVDDSQDWDIGMKVKS